jgi:hypothetical protein
MFINAVPAEQLATIVAGLVREGICFKANPDDDAGRTFTIELTGGH